MTGEFSNRTLGRYQMLDLLGRGGMGEVYRARDTSLGRDLAIKVLPPELTRDPTRVERFTQEARAASALNHPHLTAIYEIGTEPVHYIAMELVHGRNLRDVLGTGRLDLKRALDYLLQICDALGAGHQAGVVHRDIKPENVMIGDNGYAKILDFGVAKLKAEASAGADDATRAALTDAGVMVGTSGYMSPEQARGQAIDHRTDIFSLGCVLYECVTGACAFDAPSAVERMNRVINEDPAPLLDRAPNAPADLVRVVRKCLAKDPDDRYQSMKDLAIDLRDVRRQLETGVASNDAQPVVVVRSRRPLIWAIAALVIAAGGAFLYQRGPIPALPSAAPSQPPTIDRLTTTGNSINSSISPDGAFLAHVEAVGNRQSLWIREIKTGQARQLVGEEGHSFYGVKIAPDGRDVFYTIRGKGFGSGRLYAISRDGGEPRLVLSGITTSVTFSPDGRQLAFYREQYPDLDSSALIMADVSGNNERVIATRRAPEAFSPGFFVAPSWSPDGRLIAASARNFRLSTAKLIAFDPLSTESRELMSADGEILHTMWLPDGSGIVYTQFSQLWLKPFPDGPPRRLTSDLIEYRQTTVTADGTVLAAIGQETHGQINLVPLDGSPLRRIRSERYDGVHGVVQLRDGSFIASTVMNGNTQVMRLSADGSQRTLLTTDRANAFPAVSPDETTIAMVSVADRKRGVWTMGIDGSNQRLAAELPSPDWLSFTPDGRHIVCTSLGSSTPSTWRIPVEGGQPVEITRQFDRGAISPDGKWLAGVYNATVNAVVMSPMMAVLPLDGSAPVRSLAPMATATGTGFLTWAKDSSGIIASSNERFNLFFFPLRGGPPKRLTNLDESIFVRGSLSPDGKSVVASRGMLLRDTFVIRGFK